RHRPPKLVVTGRSRETDVPDNIVQSCSRRPSTSNRMKRRCARPGRPLRPFAFCPYDEYGLVSTFDTLKSEAAIRRSG
ncbi:MAG: hypothetical protein M3509_03950, partial [Chloroflexota bacterium]|nr:hypothetical protein [Chloroflexota bacterium]